ncbi:EGF-like repeat and discoidin I-like domain-containing protein 3 [Mizuhopecten yessoensis]|uniref:Lactadherin n=1 Tax=Mizuhopecten yessoensis TaxID=6573 RepID=A0A210QFE4_MIZYE|nr:EGF-like repeat and discoidin I-like domain-containing protein 3 [Mizuhopecten yessoensis]OWF47460.1 Lactadherin [Mizuhopecten yessoensis]
MIQFIILLLIPASPIAADDGVFDIRFPNVIVAAQSNGNISLQSGDATRDLYILPGSTDGMVYFEGEDLLSILEIAKSLPPVWSNHAHNGFFGTFKGDENVDIKLEAEDPEGEHITFEIVAGALPPGITLDVTSGHVKGVIPDVTGSYSFTIRAQDTHGKYADSVFKMETLEFDHCSSSPCLHNGQCTDTTGGFTCNCTTDYGGQKCETACRSKVINIRSPSVIPDAQMTAFRSYSSYLASNGRYGASGYGWCGTSTDSWLQVDLGHVTKIYRVETQGYSSHQYTKTYSMSYSTDGNTFYKVDPVNGAGSIFSASYSTSSTVHTLNVPVNARFVRFHPNTFVVRPCFKVELIGCRVLSLN